MAIHSKSVLLLPPVGRLDAVLEYHIFTGHIIRRATNKIINRVNSAGYRIVDIDGITYTAHRVIWKMFYGKDPENQIDHIDGDRSNNIITNLRSVTQQENLRNQKLSVSNTSGVVGVSWNKKMNKWKAHIVVDQRQIHLGVFLNKEDAIAARKAAEVEIGFHPNHGRS